MGDSFQKIACTHCGAEQVENFKFCSNCGKCSANIVNRERKRSKKFDINLKFLSGYALFTIFLLLIASLTDESFKLIVILTVLFALVDIFFAVAQPSVWRLLKLDNLKVGPTLSIIGICIATGVVVSYSMDSLNLILFEESLRTMPLFYHLDYPLLGAIIFVSVSPALFEELAFRGFVYNNIKVLSGESAAIWGSTFLFAIVHFSLLSLIWIIPFGLLLAHYRKKHSTLFYGILGHFTHNTTTLLIEYYGLL